MFKKYGAFLTLLMVVFALTACNNKSAEDNQNTQSPEENTSTTKTVEGVFGDVTIPTNPQNMLVFNSNYAEYLLSIGVVPQKVLVVEEIEPDYRPKLFNENHVEMINTPQYEKNLEQILSLAPDLIVVQGNVMDSQQYEELSKIAPTLAVNASASLEEALPELGKIFEKEKEAEATLTAYQNKVAEAKQKLQQTLSDKTVMVLRVEPKQYRFMGANGNGPGSDVIYQQLGLQIPELLADAENWFNPLSVEVLPDIKADYIFIEKRVLENYSSDQLMAELESNPLWQSMEAVQNGMVFPLETKDFVVGQGPIGSALLIDYIVEKLVP
ncbi:ABC transporter substrate-binding protein [Metasolibacillus meyeri]|uniref:ABC transporter substrate-binding protein n=1 Tax=Metasolibacillus meyeri TaxID=1071052 RepID=A0AAW9NIZ9_9BACL|nr:ABC transporter substrate-binding protein [Metasolibacillus meyeri]MEC1178654.1 ABC transporter substrate-binding protein [Metasolibacillus meyeri]